MVRDEALLLVEDDADDALLILRTLKKHNLCNDVLVVARDGEEALEYLFATGRHEGRDPSDLLPQVVLLEDLNLPKVDGLEVLGRLRADERTRLLPVVVLTASSAEQEEDVVGGYGLGIDGFVRKPAEAGRFREAVMELGLYRFDLNEPPTTSG